MMQVVKLADMGVAGFQHLQVQLGGNRLQGIGIDRLGKGIHQLTPSPETVVLGAVSVSTPLGHPGHGPLKCM